MNNNRGLFLAALSLFVLHVAFALWTMHNILGEFPVRSSPSQSYRAASSGWLLSVILFNVFSTVLCVAYRRASRKNEEHTGLDTFFRILCGFFVLGNILLAVASIGLMLILNA